jgi:hypothetical protein
MNLRHFRLPSFDRDAARRGRRPVIVRSLTSSRIGQAVTVAAICILIVSPTLTTAATAPPASEPASSIEEALLARGLLTKPPPDTIQPPAGIEVDEYVQKDSNSGEELVRYKQWQETVAGRTMQVQLLKYPAGQQTIAFWVMQPSGPGCALFGNRAYNTKGGEMSGGLWLNDPDLKIPGGVEFPPDLVPGWVPPIAFLRAVNDGSPNAEGALHVQLGAYSFATVDVWTEGPVDLTVPGGNFRASKVMMRSNIQSVLPSWPTFLVKIIQSLLHFSTFYFDASPPHRLLEIDGPGSLGGRDTKTELVRFYTSGSSGTADAK